MKRAQPRVRVDQAELRGRHAQLDAARRHADVAGQRELEAAADRVPVERGQHRVGIGVERLDRVVERVRHQRLGRAPRSSSRRGCRGRSPAENMLPSPVSTRQRASSPPDRLGERVQDLVVERPALVGVRDLQPGDVLRRLVEQQLAGCELTRRATRGQPACPPPTPTGPPRR